MTESKKQLNFKAAFPGSNTVLLQARVSRELYEALVAEGKKRNQSIPDLIRSFVIFHLLPEKIKNNVEKGIELNTEDREILKAYNAHLTELAEACSSIDEAQEKTKLVKRHLKGFDKMLEEAAERAVERILARKKGAVK